MHTDSPGSVSTRHAAIVGALIAVLHFPVLGGMASDWFTEPTTRHGAFAMAFAMLLAWRWWQRRSSGSGDGLVIRVAPAPAAGLTLLGLALFLLLIGFFGGDFFVMRIAFWLTVAASAIALLGWQLTWDLRFPLFVLLWTIRLPQLIFVPIVVPLRQASEWIATQFLRQIAGIAVYHDGEMIEIAGARIEGVDVFLAMRLAVSVAFFAMAYAYCASSRTVVRVAFPVITLAVYVLAVAAYGGAVLWLFDHDVTAPLRWSTRFTEFIPAIATLAVCCGLHWLKVRPQQHQELMAANLPAATGPSSGARYAFAATAGMLCLEIAVFYSYPGIRDVPPRQRLQSMPAAIGDWTSVRDVALTDDEVRLLKADAVLNRFYQSNPGAAAAGGPVTINLTTAYYNSQRGKASPHSPRVCLMGSGWLPTDGGLIDIRTGGGKRVTVNRFILTKDGEELFLLYWFVSQQSTFSSEYAAKFDTLWRSFVHHRNDTAFVRVAVNAGGRGYPPLAEAERAGIEFASQAYDSVMQLLPR